MDLFSTNSIFKTKTGRYLPGPILLLLLFALFISGKTVWSATISDFKGASPTIITTPGTEIPRQCPKGTVGRWPNCIKLIQQKCPRGSKGVWPNCRTVIQPRKCPKGASGTWPNCRSIIQPRKCPKGTTGRWPNCRTPIQPRKCPKGTTGRWPNCRTTIQPRKCPEGASGIWPNCRKIIKPIPRACPKGTQGQWPNCKNIIKPRPSVCPPGTWGRWPNCSQVVAPTPPIESNIKPTKPAPQPTPIIAAAEPLKDQRPDEVVLMIRSQADASAIAKTYQLQALRGENNGLLQSRIQHFQIPDNRSVDAVLAAMKGDQRILLSQPNHLYRLQQGMNQSGRIMGQYAATKMNLSATHDLSQGEGVVVAVIDSAIDTQHTELNGVIERSFNATNKRSSTQDSHGTAVASIIGGQDQLWGVAPACRLLAVRAFFQEKDELLTTSFTLLRAIDWAHKNRAQILNLSFTGPKDAALERILKAAHDKGIVSIAAAGNGGSQAPTAYPAAYSEVIAVTAIDKADKLYTKANHGHYIDLAAPGVDLLVAVPSGSYGFESGTSFATAHISGLTAMMLARNPDLTPSRIRSLLLTHADDLGPKGKDAIYGAGRVDTLDSVKAASK